MEEEEAILPGYRFVDRGVVDHYDGGPAAVVGQLRLLTRFQKVADAGPGDLYRAFQKSRPDVFVLFIGRDVEMGAEYVDLCLTGFYAEGMGSIGGNFKIGFPGDLDLPGLPGEGGRVTDRAGGVKPYVAAVGKDQLVLPAAGDEQRVEVSGSAG